MVTEQLPLDAIQLGERYRRDMGDLRGLANSMAAHGLLHPVVVTRDHTLIAGGRRLEAARLLGWNEVPVTVIDVDDLLLAEQDENAQRKDFTPTEAVAIGRIIEERHRARIASVAPILRRASGLARQHGSEMANRHAAGVPRFGATVNAASRAVGMGRHKYEGAKLVVDAATEDPATFGDLPARMDETGNVNGALREVERRRAIKDGKTTPVRHEVHRKHWHPKANDLVQRAVTAIEGIVLGLKDVDLTQLEPAKCGQWSESLCESLKFLNRFRKEIDQNGQYGRSGSKGATSAH